MIAQILVGQMFLNRKKIKSKLTKVIFYFSSFFFDWQEGKLLEHWRITGKIEISNFSPNGIFFRVIMPFLIHFQLLFALVFPRFCFTFTNAEIFVIKISNFKFRFSIWRASIYLWIKPQRREKIILERTSKQTEYKQNCIEKRTLFRIEE